MQATSIGREEASSLLPLRSLAPRNSEDEDSDLDLFAEEDYAHGFDAIDYSQTSRGKSHWSRLLSSLPIPRLPVPGFLQYQKLPSPPPVASRDGPWKAKVVLWLFLLFLFWVIFIAAFIPSYSRPPQHYLDLRKRALVSSELGRANPNNEQVFIAASIYDKDGSLISGAYGDNLKALVNLLGPKNVFLSIYENDAEVKASEALYAFRRGLECENIVLNEHLDTSDLQHVIMPDGRKLLKRISFLAKVRNRALMPLDDHNSPVRNTKFDKLLYVNDIVFDPIDAANLLLSTNVGEDGRTQYRAACATDFINPFKFYDTFATRDLEGYDMGVPFYPWFAHVGAAASRNDVLAQKDAVRVRSCWGGMVAFKASYFLNDPVDRPTLTPPRRRLLQPREDDERDPDAKNDFLPARFRAEEDPFWDASECCLIHADIQHAQPKNLTEDTEIYMNPYIRVAYDTRTLSWLGITRRFERMSAPAQHIMNLIGKRPSFNPRQNEEPGQKVQDRVWISDEKSGTGSYQDVERIAKPGGFCGGRKLLALPDDGHGGHWWNQPPPPDV
ncbi:cryptococcal mannosyltransferase 1-domain-containing protein [Elsinoe ampelina]|uniref:Cryptococcal mannosyltransferase 1-domain-containing protein n=1 Tax=Elsinoe ampelina TaxID=302913 RepID=A0A6A6FZU5_9PEZI|nr:cryptococcal mannosyltransferase 1-domain-containing protein [Elsinoe ampelina]